MIRHRSSTVIRVREHVLNAAELLIGEDILKALFEMGPGIDEHRRDALELFAKLVVAALTTEAGAGAVIDAGVLRQCGVVVEDEGLKDSAVCEVAALCVVDGHVRYLRTQ